MIQIPVIGKTENDSLYTGNIQVPIGKKPADCYTIIRDGKEIIPKFQDEPVFNNDKIRPKNNIKIKISYRHSKCKTIYVRNETTVNCNHIPSNIIARFKELLGNLLKKKRVLRYNLESKYAVTTRNIPDDNTSCFPYQPFVLSPLPPNGASILSGQYILFRRDDFFLESGNACSKAKLVVTQKQDTSYVKEIEVIIGKIVKLDGSHYKPGKTYEWYLKQNNKIISETNYFKILDKKTSDNIVSQLEQIKTIYANECPGLKQALFLSLINESAPGFDFSADSIRLMWENRTCKDNSGVWEELLFILQNKYK